MKGLQDQKGNGPRSIVIRRWWKKVASCYLLYNADLKSEDQVKSKRLFWNRCSKPRLAGLYWTTQKPLTTFGHLNSLQAHTTNQKSQPLKSLTRNEASTKEESWSNSIIISHHQINASVPNSGTLDSTWNRNWVNLYILVHSWSYIQLPAIQEADLLPSCPDLLKLHHANWSSTTTIQSLTNDWKQIIKLRRPSRFYVYQRSLFLYQTSSYSLDLPPCRETRFRALSVTCNSLLSRSLTSCHPTSYGHRIQLSQTTITSSAIISLELSETCIY